MKRALIRKTLFIIAIVLASAFAILRAPLRLGLDLRGGVSLILRVKTEDASPEQKREVVEQTRQVLERRINAFGLSEAPLQPYGSRGDELLVQFPGIGDSSRIEILLKRRGVLEWHSVEDGPFTSAAQAMAARRHCALQPEVGCHKAGNRSGARLVPVRQPAHHPWYGLARRPLGCRRDGATCYRVHAEPGCGSAL